MCHGHIPIFSFRDRWIRLYDCGIPHVGYASVSSSIRIQLHRKFRSDGGSSGGDNDNDNDDDDDNGDGDDDNNDSVTTVTVMIMTITKMMIMKMMMV